MRQSTLLALIGTLAAPLVVLAGTGLVAPNQNCNVSVSSITIDIDLQLHKAIATPDPACVTTGSTITFQAGSSGRFIAVFGNDHPFKNHKNEPNVFSDAPSGQTQDSIDSGLKGNEYSYIVCWAPKGSHSLTCKDPKIIVNPNQLIITGEPSLATPATVHQLTLTNVGDSTVTVGEIEPIGKSKDNFNVASTCNGKELPPLPPPNGSCTAAVTFTGRGTQTVDLVVTYKGKNGQGFELTAPVTGKQQ